MRLGIMSFGATLAAPKQKNLISGSIKVHETSPFGYLFKIIERVLFLLKACFIFPFFLFLIHFQRHMHKTK